MKTVFKIEQAKKAYSVFNTLIEQAKSIPNLKNKSIICATLIAYNGATTKDFLKKALPGKQVDDVIRTLTDCCIIEVVDDTAKNKQYTITEVVEQEAAKLNNKLPSEQALFIFTNALYNLDVYIQKYNIQSWNALASILELPSHLLISSPVFSYSISEMISVPGKDFNKRQVRNSLVEMGLLKPAVTVKKGERNNKFKLNKRAYLLGTV